MYLVDDNDAQQPFAAKTFREDTLAQQLEIAERFRNEARAWIELESAGKCHDVRKALSELSRKFKDTSIDILLAEEYRQSMDFVQ